MGNKTDGVICANLKALREVLKDPEIKKPQPVWRIEVIDKEAECLYWEPKRAK